MTIMPWRFLEMKTSPAPRRPRVRLLRPIPTPKELERSTWPVVRRAAWRARSS